MLRKFRLELQKQNIAGWPSGGIALSESFRSRKKEKMELALHYKREQCPPYEASVSPSWSLVLFSSRVNSRRYLLLLLLILLLLSPSSSCCHNTYIVGMEEEEEEQEEQLPKAVAERSPTASPAPPPSPTPQNLRHKQTDGRSEFIYKM
jgi:hypothetical protein